MPTKLGRYCEGVMEAAWLVAVIVVPVFFNIYSSRIFEPDKITLARTLGLVILAAWVVKLIEAGGVSRDRLEPGEPWYKIFWRVPLLGPVTALVIVYIVSTIFSVTPRTSFLGSYQRLQGTYTTFTYIVVFASMVANLRRREQVERLVSVAILTSLPVSLYGVLQRYKLDPIPWGGDVTVRIASNMGNSIFVAAYLIMTVPLTLLRIVESFESLLQDKRGKQVADFARATVYVFILVLEAIAIYYSGSRGPWLGIAAGLVFMWLGLSLIWRARWLTITGVVTALAAATFLIVLNIPNGPLESLRTRPEFGRLGQLLDAESRTGRVRTLIWEGAAKLVQPHDPLEFPDGKKDALNFLRPLIGYGPESMYVAYNPFYPPALTQVEKRNASPDRSHNETWDSLVITGVLGLVAYLTLFGSVLYYGLKWLGLVPGKRQRNLYLALYLVGGVASAVFFVLWKGVPYLGVALPFGMILGVIVYLILASLFTRFEPITPQGRMRAYLLLGLLAAVMAHFVEINFGIAIASTRTYFWMYAALLLLVGYILPKYSEYHLGQAAKAPAVPQGGEAKNIALPSNGNAVAAQERKSADSQAAASAARKKRRLAAVSKSEGSHPMAGWAQQALVAGLIVGVILSTMGYLYITNSSRATSAFGIMWASFTQLKSGSNSSSSYGLLLLVSTIWVIGTVLLVSESMALSGSSASTSVSTDFNTWIKTVGLGMTFSFVLALIFWLWHANGLYQLLKLPSASMNDILNQVKYSEGILSTYYTFLFIFLFGLAFALVPGWPSRLARLDAISVISALAALIVAFSLASYTNLRIIQADIAFKTAELFARADGSWPMAIEIYSRANDLAPSEDYYYLFLGRAYLEQAKTLTEVKDRDRVIDQAAKDLKKAQQINPLNTDHTANLARLYNLWATNTSDASLRQQRADQANEYFSQAVVLSPNNARLWDEWALLYLSVLNQPQEALDRLNHALEIDSFYDWTYGLLGDYYNRYVAAPAEAQSAEQIQAYQQSAEYYTKAISLAGGDTTTSMKYGYHMALASNQIQLQQYDQAIASYQQALQVYPSTPDKWKIEEALARLYIQKQDAAAALSYLQSALQDAPDDQKQRLSDMIAQMGGQP